MTITARDHVGLVVAVVVSFVAYGAMVVLDLRYGTLRDGLTPVTIALTLLATVGFIIAVVWQRRRGIPWRALVVLPLVFRLLMLLTSPTLSDDVYRYLWDGHLATQGVNPYLYAIEDPRHDPHEIEARVLANNRSYATPYLPAAQAVFAASAVVGPSQPITMQVVMVAFDVMVLVLLVRLLALAGLPREHMMLYWWNPLVIVEVAHGAHLDAMIVALTLLAAYLTFQTPAGWLQPWMAPVALAAATLTRPLPVLLGAVVWWRWSWFQRLLYPAAMAAPIAAYAVTGGLGLFGEPKRTGVFGATRVFVHEARFNGGVYNWMEGLLGALRSDDAAAAAAAARATSGAILVAVTLAAWWLARRLGGPDDVRPALRLAVVPFMAVIVLTSIFHPWYLLIVLAFVPFLAPEPSEGRWRWWQVGPWLYLAAMLPFSYLTYRDPDNFSEVPAVLYLEWVPTLAALAVAAVFTVRYIDDTAATPMGRRALG